jgi:hypothetical protein
MQAFEIERQTHQTPRSDREPAGARRSFSSSHPQAAQRELAEAQDFLICVQMKKGTKQGLGTFND